MLNLFAGLKNILIGAAATSSVVMPSMAPVAFSSPARIFALERVQGQYSFFGQSIKYLFIVPKKGGDFNGDVQGSCQAEVRGNYEGGNGGRIAGKAHGKCNFLGIKYQGATSFTGRLYPETKTVEIEIDNSPVKGPFKANYH